MVVNIDTLEVSFNVLNYEENVIEYLDILEIRKAERSTRLHSGSDDKSYVDILDQSFEVLHAGKHGYAYILHNDDMELNIARFRSRVQDFYPIRVRFKAKLLWEKGRDAYDYIADFVTRAFGEFDTDKVGRVDFACHTDSICPTVKDWDDFVGRFKSDQAIRFNRKLETFYFGSRKTQKCYCRIYNKTKKCLRDKENEWFFDIWNENGMDLFNVWNIEFELHRGMLKEMNVETFEDLEKQINSIWLYLTTSWLTWRVPGSAGRRTRLHINPEWIDIQSAYKDFKFKGFIERYRQRMKDTSKYIPAISGYITSLSALLNVDDIDYSMTYIKKAIEEYIDQKKKSTFIDQVSEKKKVYVNRGNDELSLMLDMSSNIHSGKEVRLSKKIADEKVVLDLMLQSYKESDLLVVNQRKYLNKLMSKLIELRK